MPHQTQTLQATTEHYNIIAALNEVIGDNQLSAILKTQRTDIIKKKLEKKMYFN